MFIIKLQFRSIVHEKLNQLVKIIYRKNSTCESINIKRVKTKSTYTTGNIFFSRNLLSINDKINFYSHSSRRAEFDTKKKRIK